LCSHERSEITQRGYRDRTGAAPESGAVDDELPLSGRLERLDLLLYLLCDLEAQDHVGADAMLNELLISAWPTRFSQDH
jgi:hypothetical protein